MSDELLQTLRLGSRGNCGLAVKTLRAAIGVAETVVNIDAARDVVADDGSSGAWLIEAFSG